jgi:hypothetical protein
MYINHNWVWGRYFPTTKNSSLTTRAGRGSFKQKIVVIDPILIRIDTGTENKTIRESFPLCLMIKSSQRCAKFNCPMDDWTSPTPETVWKQPSFQTVLCCYDSRNLVKKRMPVQETRYFAISQHIPTIFRHAQKTILVRNSAGLQGCCAQAIGQIDSEADLIPCQDNLTEHLLSVLYTYKTTTE